MDNKEVIDLSDEFTFTFLDNADIEIKYQELESTQKDIQAELDSSLLISKELYDEILAFINKLMSNPDKDTIKWPNRISDLNKFKNKIIKIYKKDELSKNL